MTVSPPKSPTSKYLGDYVSTYEFWRNTNSQFIVASLKVLQHRLIKESSSQILIIYLGKVNKKFGKVYFRKAILETAAYW